MQILHEHCMPQRAIMSRLLNFYLLLLLLFFSILLFFSNRPKRRMINMLIDLFTPTPTQTATLSISIAYYYLAYCFLAQ